MAIVDVRSDYEYRTLCIRDAINISLSDLDFAARVRALREKTANAIVFYCSGVTCPKSYDATLLVKNIRVADVYAYDTGVMAWAKAYPDHTELLGRSPVRPKDLIDKARFDAHSVTPEAFAAKMGGSADRIQRDNPLFLLLERKASLNQVAQLAAIVDEAKAVRKTLLIYDAAGKQAQWSQCELGARGVKIILYEERCRCVLGASIRQERRYPNPWDTAVLPPSRSKDTPKYSRAMQRISASSAGGSF